MLSLVHLLLTDQTKRYNALVLMDWGVETVTSLMQNAILALVAHPECQKKAQEEMDRVVGAERMPTLADYKNLPYLRAFMEEVCQFLSWKFHVAKLRNQNAASTIQALVPISHTTHGYGRPIGQSLYLLRYLIGLMNRIP